MIRRTLLWFIVLGLILSPVLAVAAVEVELVQDLALSDRPLDVALAPNGKHIYVLTDAGQVVVFDAQGKQEDVIAVGKDIKAIAIGPGDNTLMLIPADKPRVRMARLEFIHSINTTGSPFKGKADAPVAVVVFSDFQ